jgi:hypothetical protein
MGKAKVYEHLGDGLYRVLYQPDVSDSTARIAELEALKVSLDAQMYSTNGLVEGRTTAETVYNKATMFFEYALADWAWCAMQLPPCPDQGALMNTVKSRGIERAEASIALNTIKAVISENRAQYYSVTLEIAYLANSAKGASKGGLMDLWCIDYDPSNIIPVEANVGTIETFGANSDVYSGWLPRAYINIKSSTDPAHDAADKCIKPIKDWKVAAAIYAYCQWLYVMANNPLHAIGTVLSKFDPDQDYLDLELFGNTPSHQGPQGYPFVSGDSSRILLNVPVDYLSCGAMAFEAGDLAVVRFADVNLAAPTVIGFAEHPALCGPMLAYVKTIWPGDSVASIRKIFSESCVTTFDSVTHEPNTIGCLDWIDASGDAKLWLPISGSVVGYRYGKHISMNYSGHTIHRAGKPSVTVTGDIYGITLFNGLVLYVTRTSTHFELRKTSDESVIASIALSDIVDVMPVYSGVTTLITHMIDGWFKFSADGSSGATLISSHRYVAISITASGDSVEAEFSIELTPTTYTSAERTAAFTEIIIGFCPIYFFNDISCTTLTWALDFIGNELNFLFIDSCTESLSLPTSTPSGEPMNDWRRIAYTSNYYRIGINGEKSTDGLLLKTSEMIHYTHLKDWVQNLEGTGFVRMTDLDIRRRAAAFCGNYYSVTSPTSARNTAAAYLAFEGNNTVITGLATTEPDPFEYPNASVSYDGGYIMGGTPDSEPCGYLPTSSSSTSPDATGKLIFDSAPFRADIFPVKNGLGLFFINAEVKKQYQFCDGFENITSQIGAHPTQYGY